MKEMLYLQVSAGLGKEEYLAMIHCPSAPAIIGTILPGGDTCYNGCDTGWDGADPCCCCNCCSKPPPQYKCVHDTCVATPTGGINKNTCEAVCG
jgi:hypothetical protein